ERSDSMLRHPPLPRRSGRTLVAVVIYLVSFGILLALVSKYYLIPALIAKQTTDNPKAKEVLAASSRLILCLVLFVLLMGLLLTFRIGRFFFPRKRDPMKPTPYTDIWSEAGRRLKVPPEEDEEAK